MSEEEVAYEDWEQEVDEVEKNKQQEAQKESEQEKAVDEKKE